MIVLDVNVLLAAHLSGHPHHGPAHAFVTAALSDDTVVVPDAVWIGFLRLATNARIFETPSSLDEASAFVRAVTRSSGYRGVPGLADGVEDLLELCAASDAIANLVPDAYIAAVALAHGCPVATFDRDFRRFDGVALITPS